MSEVSNTSKAWLDELPDDVRREIEQYLDDYEASLRRGLDAMFAEEEKQKKLTKSARKKRE